MWVDGSITLLPMHEPLCQLPTYLVERKIDWLARSPPSPCLCNPHGPAIALGSTTPHALSAAWPSSSIYEHGKQAG
jgi:hypothetical protein